MKDKLIDATKYLEKVCTYKETGCGSCKLQTVCPKDAPEVDAIPVEWINNYLWHIMATNKITSVEERSFKMMGIKDMLFTWEHRGKENE